MAAFAILIVMIVPLAKDIECPSFPSEATAGTYIYLGGRSSKGGTVASGNVATYLEVEELRF